MRKMTENVKKSNENTKPIDGKLKSLNDSTLLSVNGIIKIYKQGKIEVVALNDVSFNVNGGEIVLIMGPSGCGKTTLLNLIGGLDIPDAGSIIVNDRNMIDIQGVALDEFRRENIGFVFQFLNLIPTLTAYENIAISLIHSKLSKKEKDAKIMELLELVDLVDRKDHKPDALSGGEQQRIAIASALANEPTVLLADEPTGELDSRTQKDILALFQKLVEKNKSRIIIIVSHDPRLQEVADKILYIKDGAIMFEKAGGSTDSSINAVDEAVDSQKILQMSAEMSHMRDQINDFHELKRIIKKAYEKIKD
jgi:putative ABC transport system ATP-binding protein